jgi:hypothetical protein
VAAAAQGGRGPRQADASRHHPHEGRARPGGVAITPEDLETILSIDTARWKQEIEYRVQHLEQFTGLPEEIWRRTTASLPLSTTRTEPLGPPAAG